MTNQDDVKRAWSRLRLEARFAWDIARARRRSMSGSPRPETPLILNSLPKSGTHLAIKLLENMPGIERIRFQLSSRNAVLFAPSWPDEEVLDIGVASPRAATVAGVRRRLSMIPPGAFITSHIPYSSTLADMLRGFGFRMVLLLRDPRDVAVSSASYLASGREHALTPALTTMSPSQRLLASIEGVKTGTVELADLRARVESTRAWQREAMTETVRFEDLVGPLGGGDFLLQQQSILSIARHIGVTLDDVGAKRLAQTLYGGTTTFRRGQIGGWREVFGASHREAVGRLLGDVLLELGYEEDKSWWRDPNNSGLQNGRSTRASGVGE